MCPLQGVAHLVLPKPNQPLCCLRQRGSLGCGNNWELKALGSSEDVALRVAGNCQRWGRNSDGAINRVLTMAYFDQLGVPRLS